jgi:RNA polymerase sigma-70 factor (ECF subfamily)
VKTSVPQRDQFERGELFASTRWTMVLEAGDSSVASAHSLSALSELCRIYWRPLYFFLRRTGYRPHDAQDLTQGFFADLIATRSYARANREKGRFRSFLLGALKYFVADARDHDRAVKRGGGMIMEELNDKALAEAESQIGKTKNWQAAEVYDREWAASLLRHALNRLAKECALAGKSELFVYLKPYLSTTVEGGVPYDEMARRLRRPISTLRSDVARLRARYRAILREEVRGTVRESVDVDDELRYLCRALAGA